jgi:hypothetical protein
MSRPASVHTVVGRNVGIEQSPWGMALPEVDAAAEIAHKHNRFAGILSWFW